MARRKIIAGNWKMNMTPTEDVYKRQLRVRSGMDRTHFL